MKFFSDVRSSIRGPLYYKGILEGRPLSSSVWYFSIFIVTASLIGSILFATLATPGLMQALRTTSKTVIESFPSDLTVSIENGKATSTYTEPYAIPYPFEQNEKNDHVFMNLFLVDTTHPFDVNTFNAYSPLFGLNDSTIALYDNGKITVSSLKGIPSTTLSKKSLSAVHARIEPYFPFVPMIIGVLYFLLALSFTSGVFLYLFLAAPLIMLIGKMKHVEIKYMQAYQIGLHASTLPVLIDGTLRIFGLSPSFFVFFTILLLGSVAMNIRSYGAVQGTSA